MSDAQDPASRTGYVDPPPRVGFFTDTSVCIGCKACEVACKEWNGVPADGLNLLGSSYDNTGGLGASTLAARRLRGTGTPWTGAAGPARGRAARRPEHPGERT